MFVYEKKLQYPVNIKNPNLKLAKIIASQYGGAYCERLCFINKSKSLYLVLYGRKQFY